jgi:hypothetical protein
MELQYSAQHGASKCPPPEKDFSSKKFLSQDTKFRSVSRRFEKGPEGCHLNDETAPPDLKNGTPSARKRFFFNDSQPAGCCWEMIVALSSEWEVSRGIESHK